MAPDKVYNLSYDTNSDADHVSPKVCIEHLRGAESSQAHSNRPPAKVVLNSKTFRGKARGSRRHQRFFWTLSDTEIQDIDRALASFQRK